MTRKRYTEVSAKVRDYMDMIDRNTTRLEKYVSEILTTVKAGENEQTIDRQDLDLTELAQDALRQFPEAASRLKANWDGPVLLKGNAEALRQVLSNLLSNALKFCQEGVITLSIYKGAGHVECNVVDSGTGIARADLERIFQPFVQSDGGKRLAKGTGLGLAIAQRWVIAHGGRIWAESEGPGKGARFVFQLPVFDPQLK